MDIDSILTLGGDDRDASYYFESNPTQLTVIPGNLLVVAGNPLPMVFDLDGRFLRTLGHSGSGPGEFPLAPLRFWVAPGNELHFVVRGHLLVIVYRPDGTFVRQYRLSHSVRDPEPLPDGRIVGQHPSGQFRGNEAIDLPLVRLFSPDGHLVREIGRGVTIADRGMFAGLDGTIWTWKSFPYSLRQWASDGRQLASLDRVIPNFGTGRFIVDPGKLYSQPRILSAREHADGLLWVTFLDAPPRKNCPGPIEACWDTVVEVLDLSTGALIASARAPATLPHDMGDGLFASFRSSTGRGSPVVIFRARLVRPPSGAPQ